MAVGDIKPIDDGAASQSISDQLKVDSNVLVTPHASRLDQQYRNDLRPANQAT